MKQPDFVEVCGIELDAITIPQTLAYVTEYMQESRLHQLCTANPEFAVVAQENPEFLQLLNDADLCFADGIGLVYGAKLKGKSLPERVPGSEMVYHLAKLCAENGWKLFLLGAADGVAEQTADKFRELYPDLQIAGTYAGTPRLEDNDAIVQRINDSEADMLFVAYGAPKQDFWIARNKDVLTTVRVAVGIGGSFNFVAGVVPRAPVWVQRINLEWLYRLFVEPARFSRMAHTIPKFLLLLLKDL